MKRRSLRAGAGATALARPSLAGQSSLLRIIPQLMLNSIDLVWSSSQIARNMGFMVFDLLYGRDEAMNARPQMVEADLMEDDGRRWTLRLRQNLCWHDGEKVLARDCVASLRRWMKRNSAGGTLEARLDFLETIDDRTFVLRLNKPLPASASLAVTVHHSSCHDAGTSGQDGPVQADPRGNWQRSVPLAGG